MMYDFKELIEKTERLYNDLDSILKDESKIYALNAKALVQYTIQSEGFGAEYSDKKVPVFFFYGSALNNKGKKFVKDKQKQKEKYSNWSEFRSAQGLQNNFVDLTYSGKMFNGMTPGETVVNGGYYFTPIEHNNTEGAQKMQYNFKRYGDFFKKALEGEPGEKLGKALENSLYNIFIKYLE